MPLGHLFRLCSCGYRLALYSLYYFFFCFVFVLRLTSRVCPASALPVSVLKSYPSLSHHCYYVSVCILLSFSCFSILRVFLFLISRLKLPVLCLDTSWSRGYTCSVPASFCRWSAKPVLSSFAFGLSTEPPFRTPFLICIPKSTGTMTRTSEAFIRVVNLTAIIAEVGNLAY